MHVTTPLESEVSESTGRAFDLDSPAAGCVQSAREGPAGDLLPVSDASAGCTASSTADVEQTRPKPPQTLRELQRALQALGYSQRTAAQIARSGFKPAEAEPDEPAADTEKLRQALDRLRRAIEN